MLKELLEKTRTYRRFDQATPITLEQLKSLVNLTRFCPSARNAQPLKYIISGEEEQNKKIFSCLAWAGALKDWPGPAEKERPTGYIIIVRDNNIATQHLCDDGIAAQTIMLGANEIGFGGCIMHAVNRIKLRKLLNIPEQYEIILVLALGKPNEEVIIEPMPTDGSFSYWRDEQQVHHVPKRSLKELLIR